MKSLDKKVLLISHNPLSSISNNGKTLASIFEGIPLDNIYQIYLNSDIPDYSEECHYLQINEKQIIKSFFNKQNICCQEVKANPASNSSTMIKVGSFGIHIKRLLRECIWSTGIWKSRLKVWLKDKNFDVVFFMAGDGLFAYDVFRLVKNNTDAKSCLFFTDDYIIGNSSISLIAILRKFLLKNKIRKTLQSTDELYVISDEMKAAYSDIFNMDGYIVRNFSVEKSFNCEDTEKNEAQTNLNIIYAGGLHYNRWKVLAQVANVLKDINDKNNLNCRLKIYSAQNISQTIIDSLTIDDTSTFCGSAKASQIANIYGNADILLHVESFEKQNIASTKYSFSTKIPEYLSSGKCVLAVGPSEVASIRYLKEFTSVVTNISDLSQEITKLLKDDLYRKKLKRRCEERYEMDFSPKQQKECLKHILFNE